MLICMNAAFCLQEWALWNGLADCYEQGLIAEVRSGSGRSGSSQNCRPASAALGTTTHTLLQLLWANLGILCIHTTSKLHTLHAVAHMHCLLPAS
jgi:hypothetical protein